MQDKHVVVFQMNEDRSTFIDKIEFSKTVYHIGGRNPQLGDICCSDKQSIDWILAQYIVDNYDNLHEYTIFTQADPDPHVHEMLLAMKSTFTANYGNFAYARAIHNQYSTTWVRWQPISLAAKLMGLDFHNDLNTLKPIFILHPGSIFYVHRDRIRERPKSFYQNMIDLDNDDNFYEYHYNYDHPNWVWRMLDNNKELKNLSKTEKIKNKSFKNERNQFWGLSIEPLWYFVFANEELFNHLDTAQAALGNKLYFDIRNQKYNIDQKFYIFPFAQSIEQTIMNFKLLENDWFDWDCPNYLKWREKLVEKTVWEGQQRGFDGLEYVKHLEQYGIKHISF
jgi:hypothetical protein